MPDHDRLFKELLTAFFIEFLELFCPSVLDYLDRDSIEFLDKETFTDVTAGEVREVDLVVRARFLGRDAYFLVHVENQGTPQADFDHRMFRYYGRLDERDGLPIYPIALFTYDAPLRAESDRYVSEFPDLRVVDFRFRVIQLNRLNWRDYVDRVNPVASALMAKMSMESDERARVKVECLRMLAKLRLDPAKTRLVSGFVDSYLELDADEEREFEAGIEAIGAPGEKEATMEIVTSWMRRGIEQGREEGIEQGREEGIEQGREEGIEQGIQQGIIRGIEQGQEQIVLRQLRRRFGSLPDEIATRIESLTSAQLVELADALLEFRDMSEVISWTRDHG